MRLLGSKVLTLLAVLLGLMSTLIVATAPERTTVVTLGEPIVSAELSGDGSETCPVMRPPAKPFVPPSPYLTKPPRGRMFWFGTERLWTMLPLDGTWAGLRPYSPSTPGLRQKIFWWRKGYDSWAEPAPQLKVTGRRLDGPAPPLVVPRATNGVAKDLKSFMLVGADIPTHGCWEITGRYKGDELTFVVSVVP